MENINVSDFMSKAIDKITFAASCGEVSERVDLSNASAADIATLFACGFELNQSCASKGSFAIVSWNLSFAPVDGYERFGDAAECVKAGFTAANMCALEDAVKDRAAEEIAKARDNDSCRIELDPTCRNYWTIQFCHGMWVESDYSISCNFYDNDGARIYETDILDDNSLDRVAYIEWSEDE